MHTEKTLSRLDYIDIAKGLGMLTIIWGHVVEFGITNSFVYAFHIPLFFVLSGCVFDRERYTNYKQFLTKKIKTLLIPYLLFSFATWAIWVIYLNLTSDNVEGIYHPLLQTFIAQGSGGYLVHNVPLWFVTCLFVVENIYWVLSKYNTKTIIIFLVLFSIIGYYLNTDPYCILYKFDTRRLPWSIEVALSAIIFFGFGHLFIKKYPHSEIISKVMSNKIHSVLIIVLLYIIVILIANYNGHVTMGSNILGNPFCFYLGAFCGMIATIMTSILLSMTKCNLSRIIKFVKWFGRNSYYAMAIHNPIKGVCVMVVISILSRAHVFNRYIIGSISFLTTLLITVISIWILHHIISFTKQHTKNR